MKEKIKELIINYYNHYNKTPSTGWLTKKTNLTKEEIKDIFIELEKDEFLIKNQKNHKYLYQNKDDKNNIKFEYNKFLIVFIKIIMLIVGTICTFISSYYTFLWLKDFLINIYAFLLSFAIVSFSVFVFETIIILKKNKQRIYYVLFVLWLIVVVFSMVSTIAGQYNIRVQKWNKVVEQESNNIEIENEIKELEKQKDFIDSQIKEKNNEKEIYFNLLKQFDSIEKREKENNYYWSIYNQFNSVNKKINELNKQYFSLIQDISNLKNQISVYKTKRNKDFYSWIGSVFKIDSEVFEFWFSLFPALFIDIISPVAFAIFMFLSKKE